MLQRRCGELDFLRGPCWGCLPGNTGKIILGRSVSRFAMGGKCKKPHPIGGIDMYSTRILAVSLIWIGSSVMLKRDGLAVVRGLANERVA